MIETLPHLRKADPSEAMDLAALAFVAWEKAILPLYRRPEFARDQVMQQMVGYCHDNIRNILVAEDESEVLGWCSRLPRRAYIPYLFVCPHAQGIGIGSLLLDRMETLLELEGHSRVQLETPAENIAAVRFYEQHGYHMLAMKAEGQDRHHPFASIRLEKQLFPYAGPVD